VSELVHSAYIGRVARALQTVSEEDVLKLVDLLADTLISGGYVFIVGNGGSATTASHMATDLGVGSQRVGVGVRAVSLSDNSGATTATGNDLSFEDIFATQIRLLGREGDVLIAISASGRSPNLIRASLEAKKQGMRVAALTGFSGGQLKEVADISIHVETDDGDYGPAEDAHLVVNHMVTELLRQRAGKSPEGKNLHD